MIVFLKSLLYFQITFNSNEPNLEGFNLQIAFSFDLLEISSLIFSDFSKFMILTNYFLHGLNPETPTQASLDC